MFLANNKKVMEQKIQFRARIPFISGQGWQGKEASLLKTPALPLGQSSSIPACSTHVMAAAGDFTASLHRTQNLISYVSGCRSISVLAFGYVIYRMIEMALGSAIQYQ